MDMLGPLAGTTGLRDADSDENILPVANERFTSYLMANISDPFSDICSYLIIISPMEFCL